MENPMKPAGERFKIWITNHAKCMTSADFARKVGEKEHTISNIINGKLKKGMSKQTLEKILRVYPKFPTLYIRTGKGETPGAETAEEINIQDDKCHKERMRIIELEVQIKGLQQMFVAKESHLTDLQTYNQEARDDIRKKEVKIDELEYKVDELLKRIDDHKNEIDRLRKLRID